MSALVLLPVIIPAAAAAWPFVAAAAMAAAGSMGYAAAKTREKTKEKAASEVDLCMTEDADAVAKDMALGEELLFEKEGVQVKFYRNTEGRLAIKVAGENRSNAELTTIGENMAKAVCQQYAYHRLVTELKSRHFNMVDQEVDEDGTVRMRVRVFQG